MTEANATYPVEDATGNPDDPSFEAVWTLMRERGLNPRVDHPDAHFDEIMTDVLEH